MHNIDIRLLVVTWTTHLPNDVSQTSGVNQSSNFPMHRILTSNCTFAFLPIEFIGWLVEPSNLFVEQIKFNTNLINTSMIFMRKTLLTKSTWIEFSIVSSFVGSYAKRQEWTDNMDNIIVLHEGHDVLETKCIHKIRCRQISVLC